MLDPLRRIVRVDRLGAVVEVAMVAALAPGPPRSHARPLDEPGALGGYHDQKLMLRFARPVE
ncbi:MAG: hypothetical protein ACXVJW_12750 [Acidimicrobiia bacterium]